MTKNSGNHNGVCRYVGAMSDENTPKRTRASHIFFTFLQESDLRYQFLEQSTLAFISKVNLYTYEWSKIFKPDKCIFSFVLGNTGSMVVLDPFVILAYNGISSWHRNTTQIGIPLLKKSTQCLNTSVSCAPACFNSKLVN